MSNLNVVLLLASASLAFAQGNAVAHHVQTHNPTVQYVSVATPQNATGNAKTVGMVTSNNQFRQAEDTMAIGNAKTVGGNVHYVNFEEKKEVVGNAKTVGNW